MNARKVINVPVGGSVKTEISEAVSLTLYNTYTQRGIGDNDYRIEFHDKLCSHGFGHRQVRTLQAAVNRILGQLGEDPVTIVVHEPELDSSLEKS